MTPPKLELTLTLDTLVECPQCAGSGFSGYGSGYDAVCGWCGGRGRVLGDTPAGCTYDVRCGKCDDCCSVDDASAKEDEADYRDRSREAWQSRGW